MLAIPFLLPTILSIALYLNSLFGEFVYDDNRAILKNADLLPETPVLNLFQNDFWGTPMIHNGSHKSYRPLCVWTYRLNFAADEFNPLGYHLVNVMLHGLVTSLFVGFVWAISNIRFISIVSGVLFASHAAHVEAVSAIIGRADLLSAVFFLLAMFCYIGYCSKRDCEAMLSNERKSQTKKKIMYVIGVFLCSISAMMCKETGITVLGLCLVYDVFIHREFLLLDIIHLRSLKKLPLEGVIIIAGSSFLLLLLRLNIMRYDAPAFAPADNPASESDSVLTRFLTFALLPCLNFWLLLCPSVLSFDWSMDAIPLVQTLTDQRNFLTFTFYISIILFVVAIFCGQKWMHSKENTGISAEKKQQNSNPSCCHRQKMFRCIILSIAWIILPFIPATNLFFYVGFVVAERILYIPSMGFCLLVAVGLKSLMERCNGLRHGTNCRRLLWLLVCILVVSNCARTFVRNRVWRNEYALYKSGIQINPAKAWGNLGNVLKAQGRSLEAEKAYKTALSYRSNMADVHYNLGLYYQEEGRFKEAKESYRLALECRPKLTVGYLNLGLVYYALGKHREAENMFHQCIDVDTSGLRDPRLHDHSKTSALYNLGRLMADQERFSDAIGAYSAAIDMKPVDYPPQSLFNMLGEAYSGLGDLDMAENFYRQALQSKPDHIPAHLTLARLLRKRNQPAAAEELFLRAHSLNPDDINVYQMYGQFLGEMGRYSEAALEYLHASKMAPDDFDTIFNTATALRQDGQFMEAENFYRRAAELKPDEVVAKMNLGAILHFNKKLAEAKSVYLAALNIRPDDKIILKNLEKLNKLMERDRY